MSEYFNKPFLIERADGLLQFLNRSRSRHQPLFSSACGIHPPIQNNSRFVHLNFGVPSPVTINSNRKGNKMDTITLENPTTQKFDLREHVTQTIIKQLEGGTIPWYQPWTSENHTALSLPKNNVTGNAIVELILSCFGDQRLKTVSKQTNGQALSSGRQRKRLSEKARKAV